MVTNNTIDKSISHNQESITPAITLFSNKFGGKSPDFVAFFRACQESSRWFKSARPLSAAPPTHPGPLPLIDTPGSRQSGPARYPDRVISP